MPKRKDCTSRDSIQVWREAAGCNRLGSRPVCPRLYAPEPRARPARRVAHRDGGPARAQSRVTETQKARTHRGSCPPAHRFCRRRRTNVAPAHHERWSCPYALFQKAGGQPAVHATRAYRIPVRDRAAGEASQDGEVSEAHGGGACGADSMGRRKANEWALRAERRVDAKSARNLSVDWTKKEGRRTLPPALPLAPHVRTGSSAAPWRRGA
jgi:hypothetical protein